MVSYRGSQKKKKIIKSDVERFIKKYDQCLKQRKIKKVSTKLLTMPAKSQLMQQTAVDTCDLPEVEYFTKWSEVKPAK